MATKKPEFIGEGGEFNLPVNPKIIAGIVLAIVLGVWIVYGGPAYTVAPEEEGIVLTFGRITDVTRPGFHLKLPWPIQTVERAKVAEEKRLEFGYRSAVDRSGEIVFKDFTDGIPQFLHEAQMLTGDENVVNCSMAVQFRIKDSLQYLFNFQSEADAMNAIRDIGEAVLRQVVGDHPIDHVLTTRKMEIQNEIHAKMQSLVDEYEIGVTITAVQLQDVLPPKEVEAAFREVASAREERERIINEARGYEREQIPRAEGEAQRMLAEAQGYKEARIARARGDVARFLALAKEYDGAQEVTHTRMYLETLSELFPKLNITVIDESAGLVNMKTVGENRVQPQRAGATLSAEGTNQ